MKIYKLLVFIFIFFGIFVIGLNEVSAKEFEAEFRGCSTIICENAGYYYNGKWKGWDCDSNVMTYEKNKPYSKYNLPGCNDAGFKGWIMILSSSNNSNDWWTFCRDADSPDDRVKKYGSCSQPVLFVDKFDYSLDNVKNKDLTQYTFIAQIGDKKVTASDSTRSITDYLGNNEDNYEEGSVVSCGPNLIKDIPSAIPSTVHIVYLILQIAVPIILVVLGTIDFIKAMVNSKDDEIKKGQKTFISRLIAGVLVFFIFSIVKLVVSLVADNSNSAKIINCVDCFISNNDKCIR